MGQDFDGDGAGCWGGGEGPRLQVESRWLGMLLKHKSLVGGWGGRRHGS